jgi:nucleoside-diphosphate-sugar epimerase
MVLVHGFGDFGATPLTEAAAATGSTQAMARKLRRRQLPLPGGGPGTISWVHVADAVTATVAALERGRPGEVYNVVDDEPVRWGDYTAELARLAEVPPPRSLPLWLARSTPPVARPCRTRPQGGTPPSSRRNGSHRSSPPPARSASRRLDPHRRVLLLPTRARHRLVGRSQHGLTPAAQSSPRTPPRRPPGSPWDQGSEART